MMTAFLTNAFVKKLIHILRKLILSFFIALSFFFGVAHAPLACQR